MPPKYSPPRRYASHWLIALLVLVGLAIAPLAGPAQAATPDLRAPLLLLGEVHDNAALHALRLQALTRLVAGGARPALLMEQFDRERQADIDRELQRAPDMAPGDAEFNATVEALVKLGSTAGGGWQWDLYRPVLKLALQYRLPIVAANVSRAEARVVMQQGLAATGWQAAVPADIARRQAEIIAASHCGQLDAAASARMALAQVARDQFMARLVALHAGRGVVLLAGNGHVRADIGVPRWLSPGLRARTRAVGALEAGGAAHDNHAEDASTYDSVLRTAAQLRADPCAGMQMPPRR